MVSSSVVGGGIQGQRPGMGYSAVRSRMSDTGWKKAASVARRPWSILRLVVYPWWQVAMTWPL